ncbi:YqgE/AlgH family protein [Edwardsiella ictaluri]|nr:YqgE/AlgH family protein [Edwardsiella ictaluri]AVZ81990.1 YqgE/AlgH family protein [Edwardsiella ictaluri]EKS7764576.1 YqgE/AlgH family protein [Edwardsiella ictaluri]EKS7771562.1 YqgE/AlgH family protein [Edwardsiella ictaluri]EKS7774612.1 YqgE/AlgH family protein [Edwardsiella ictaluri]EKS7777895.1 YqgE/AlgH family protein [Edwardsiella ictaluri]
MKLVHHFLIAMPAMQDSRFKRTVIYVCEHNEDGAMGMIINKPLEQLTLSSLLEKLDITPSPRDATIRLDKPVLAGGPLAEDRGFVLHSPTDTFGSSADIGPGCMLTTSRDVLETLGTDRQPQEILVTLGYCSWSKGQLEQELLDNTWLTVEADSQILFHTPLAERWIGAAKKLGVDIRNMPCNAGHA